MGSHEAPPSLLRSTPPTCTFAKRVPSVPWESQRVSGGPPHGVNHEWRPSAASKDAIGSADPLVSRKSRASAVPASKPVAVFRRQRAFGTSATDCQPLPSSDTMCRFSAIAQRHERNLDTKA